MKQKNEKELAIINAVEEWRNDLDAQDILKKLTAKQISELAKILNGEK